MIPHQRIPQLNKVSSGEQLSANKENVKIDVINRMKQKVNPPSQIINDSQTSTSKELDISGLWLGLRDVSKTILIAELDIDTLSIKPNRWIHAPGKSGADLGGGKNYFWHVDLGQQRLYEYNAKRMFLSRIFRASRDSVSGSSKDPFPDLPYMLGRVTAIGGKDNLFCIAGRDTGSNPPRRIVIFEVGPEPQRTITVKFTVKLSELGIPDSEININGIGMDETNVYMVTGNYHYLLSFWGNNLILEKSLFEIGTPQGAGIVNGRIFTTALDTDGLQQIQERNPVSLSIRNHRFAQVERLWGIGG